MATAPNPGPAQSERFYLPELDSLRFFAFLAVFSCHAAFIRDGWIGPISRWFLAGSFGVDLFFALSAFLISEILLREKRVYGTVHLRSFWARRVLRIWPLYFAMLAFATVFLRVVSLYQLAACLLFVGNFGFIRWGAPLLISPLWSIAVEEQFYLIWPMLATRLSRKGIAIFALCLWASSIAARAAFLPKEMGGWFMATPFRLDAIAAGLLVSSAGSLRVATSASRSGLILVGMGLWAIAQAALFVDLRWAHVSAFAMAGMGCVAFLLATLGSRFLGERHSLVYLGRISYGLYIFHMPALVVAKRLAPASFVIPIGFALTVGLASLSYTYFESPFLRLKKRFELLPSRPV